MSLIEHTVSVMFRTKIKHGKNTGNSGDVCADSSAVILT